MFRILFSMCISFFFCSLVQAESTPTLTVYTYSSFISDWGPGLKIKHLFEQQCHCQIKFKAFGDGVTLLNRLKLEGKKSKADIIIGLDNNLIAATKSADIVQPHHITPFKNQQLSWWDEDFIPYDYGYFAFIYNRQKIINPPVSMQQLLDSNNNWRIVYADPRTSTPGLGLLLWMQSIYGEKTAQAWHTMSQKTLTVTKSWSEAYSLFLQDEADFVLSYDTSPVAHLLNQHDDRYVAAAFSEGHYQQIEVAGIVKTTQQFDLAQQFLYFLASNEAQYLLAIHNIMHPVIKIALPAAFKQLMVVNKFYMMSPDMIEANRARWIETWQNAVSH
ncbi:MAG: thiamine ABC transporter substrate binding subunit [Candidatus Schmidhempelia sp.]|nr:thiamine ABC transporter substrate binding subunit [Candidatus Schmidhempelia sp.]